MRIIAIVLFIATVLLILIGLNSHSIQKAKVAQERARTLRIVRPGRGTRPPPEAVHRADTEADEALRETRSFFYVQVILTAILVPFCIYLVLRKVKDKTSITFAFSGLSGLIGFWFYVPK